MAEKNNNVWLWVGGGVFAVWYLSQKNTAPAASAALVLPQTTAPAAPAPLIGINSGIKGGNGSFYTCSNYQQLLAADPNLGNPNYMMTPDQVTTYLNNYLDLQQGLPAWIGKKFNRGTNYALQDPPANISEAAQEHWYLNGCSEKRIFYPLEPTSGAAYIPPPPSSGSSGSWVSTALSVATDVAKVAVLVGTEDDHVLNDADVEKLVTGSAILKEILPFYLQVSPKLVNSIENRIDSLLTIYS